MDVGGVYLGLVLKLRNVLRFCERFAVLLCWFQGELGSSWDIPPNSHVKILLGCESALAWSGGRTARISTRLTAGIS